MTGLSLRGGLKSQTMGDPSYALLKAIAEQYRKTQEAYKGGPFDPEASGNEAPGTRVIDSIAEKIPQSVKEFEPVAFGPFGFKGALDMSPNVGQLSQVAFPQSGEELPWEALGPLADWARYSPDALEAMVKAYHGTRRTAADAIRRTGFDPKKIGSGEGAQAFGYGHYFAENPGVAHSYKSPGWDGSTTVSFGDVDVVARQRSSPLSTNESVAAEAIERFDGNEDEAISFLMQPGPDGEVFTADKAAADLIERSRGKIKITRDPGDVLDVSIDVEPEDLLDWDLPLSEQSEKVRAALERAYGESRPMNVETMTREELQYLGRSVDPNGVWSDAEEIADFGEVQPTESLREVIRGWVEESPEYFAEDVRIGEALSDHSTGQSVIRHLEAQLGSQEAAAEALREAGIPGLRFLDQGSRGLGDTIGKLEVRRALDGTFRVTTEAGTDRGAGKVFKTMEEAQAWADNPGTRNIVIFPGEEARIGVKGAEGAAAALDEVRGKTFYHGTVVDLVPGEALDPSKAAQDIAQHASGSRDVAMGFGEDLAAIGKGTARAYPVRIDDDAVVEAMDFVDAFDDEMIEAARNRGVDVVYVPRGEGKAPQLIVLNDQAVRVVPEEAAGALSSPPKGRVGGTFRRVFVPGEGYHTERATVQDARDLVASARIDPDDFEESTRILFHSADADAGESISKEGLRTEMGEWVREVLEGATDEGVDEIAASSGVAYLSDAPTWVDMKVARKLKKPVPAVTREDVRRHGHLAIFRVDVDDEIIEAVDPGEELFRSLRGEEIDRFHRTPLYSEGDGYTGAGRLTETPVGVEPGDFITREELTPDLTLTGDDLLEFLDGYPSSGKPAKVTGGLGGKPGDVAGGRGGLAAQQGGLTE